MRTPHLLCAVLAASALLGGCAVTVSHTDDAAPAGAHAAMDMHAGPMAVASLSPAASGGATGLVMFHGMGGGLMAHVQASGFQPGSVHGFHVHDKGSCASADFSSAGGHFNPASAPHGPQDGAHHGGDMPNLVADAQGRVDVKLHLHGLTLDGPAGIAGHAVIVHAGADDYQTQPTGNSGGRIACGVIAVHTP